MSSERALNTGKIVFCPYCGMMLLLEGETGTFRFFCQTCPYVSDISHRLVRDVAIERKKVDDIMTLDQWKNVDKEKVDCPKCGNGEAYCRMSQTRSADEPMTIFYKCTNDQCQNNWRGD